MFFPRRFALRLLCGGSLAAIAVTLFLCTPRPAAALVDFVLEAEQSEPDEPPIQSPRRGRRASAIGGREPSAERELDREEETNSSGGERKLNRSVREESVTKTGEAEEGEAKPEDSRARLLKFRQSLSKLKTGRRKPRAEFAARPVEDLTAGNGGGEINEMEQEQELDFPVSRSGRDRQSASSNRRSNFTVIRPGEDVEQDTPASVPSPGKSQRPRLVSEAGRRPSASAARQPLDLTEEEDEPRRPIRRSPASRRSQGRVIQVGAEVDEEELDGGDVGATRKSVTSRSPRGGSVRRGSLLESRLDESAAMPDDLEVAAQRTGVVRTVAAADRSAVQKSGPGGSGGESSARPITNRAANPVLLPVPGEEGGDDNKSGGPALGPQPGAEGGEKGEVKAVNNTQSPDTTWMAEPGSGAPGSSPNILTPRDPGPAFAEEKSMPWIWGKDVRLIGTYLPGEGDRIGLSDYDIQLTLFSPRNVPHKDEYGFFSISPGFQEHFIHGPQRTDLPAHLYNARVEFRWQRRFSPRLALDVAVTPGIYSDFETSEGSFRLISRALGFYSLSEETQLIFGIVYLDREDLRALPAIGLIHSPSPDVRFEAVFPRPRIAHRLRSSETSEAWGYIGGEFGGGSWAIERDSGAKDIATYGDWRIVFGYEQKFQKDHSFLFELGYVFNRTLRYKTGLGEYNPDDTGMIRFGLTY